MLRVSVAARWTTSILVLAIARVNGKSDNSSCANFGDIQCDEYCFPHKANLTLKPVQSYDGGTATLTAHLNDSHHSIHLLYLFCYEAYLLNFTKIGCLESNATTASLSFTWNFTGPTSALVRVFNATKTENGRISTDEVGCALIPDIEVGANKSANVTVKLSEENRPENKSAFYAGGNITINASAILLGMEGFESPLAQSGPGCCDDQHSGYQSITYNFCYISDSWSENKTSVNLSYAFFVVSFEVGLAQSFTVTLSAINTEENEAFHGNLTTKIDVIEKVHDAVFTVNNNKTVHKNDLVAVNITVSGGLPITVTVDLTYTTTPSDQLSHNCSANFPISGTITEGNPSISNHCQFNRTGQFQLDATFNNDASIYNQKYSFTISDGPPPVVVASSTIAVVVVVVLLVVVVLSIIVIFVYVPYQTYKKRVTETANFSFIDLQMPTRWERFKIKLENWKNRLFRRDSRLGLINYSDVEEEDLLSNLYGSVNSRKS